MICARSLQIFMIAVWIDLRIANMALIIFFLFNSWFE